MLLHQAFAWLGVLAVTGAAVVCGLNLGRSRWAGLLMGAFIAEALVMGYFQIAIFLTQRGTVSAAGLGVVSLLGNLVTLGAHVCIVKGLLGLFSELAGRSAPAPAGQVGA
jgi:hypothetical protein